MKVSHVSIILIAGAACAFALNPDSSIFKIVSFAWAGFGGAFGPLILFSLYWKRTNLPGAIAVSYTHLVRLTPRCMQSTT